MQEQIVNFFHSLQFVDYLFLGISIFFVVLFFFLGVEKLYKSYLGLIIGLFVFSFINLMLYSINQNNLLGGNTFKDFLVNNRDFFAYYSVFLIIIFAFLLPLNSSFTFRISHTNWVNVISIFLFGLFLFSFFLTIFLSIFNNRFLFALNPLIVEKIKNNFLLSHIISYFSNSVFFYFLNKYDFIINLFVTLYIFYKMTIGGIIDYILSKIFDFLKNFLKSKFEGGDKGDDGGEDDGGKEDDKGHH